MPMLLENPILYTTLVIILPIIIIPLIMRFVIGKIIIHNAKKKYLPQYLQNQRRGWEIDIDAQAIDSLNTIALQRLKGAFIFKPDIQTDIKAILLCIQNIYNPTADAEKLSFAFSIRKLLDCALLFFCDFYKEYADKSWFKLIQNIRIVWLYRIWNLRKYYEIVFSNPVMDKLRRMRVLGKILRILLIPLLGLPSLIWYILRSIVISVLYEGFYRFLYALMLMKVSYYALYLYGRQNKDISKRIKGIPKQKLAELNSQIQAQLLPSAWSEKSSRYHRAVVVYLKSLEQMGIASDPEVLGEDPSFIEKTKKILDRVKTAFSKSYAKTMPFIKKQEDKHNIIEHLLTISAVYVPHADKPYKYLKIRELMATGYMASIIIIHKILATPGVNILLNKLSFNYALKMSSLARQQLVVDGAKSVGSLYKYYRLYRIGSRALKILRGLSGPGGLMWSLGSSVLFQQVQDLLREYVVHRISRLTLFTWESHILKKQTSLHPLLL
ncbi:MAG: hypothetical protein JW822_09510 [Spirochaetales bacterium]|nr:hypothetical protein [Spirochaetales bacterium]